MKLMKAFVNAVVIACLVISSSGGALSRQSETIYLPKDSVFVLELLSPITSDRNKKGDEFNCRVLEPFEAAGAIVTGHIGNIKGSGKANKKSEIALAFDSIVMGERSGVFDAQVYEVYDTPAGNNGQADDEGTVKGKSKGKIAVKRAAIGALAGAILGGVFGGAQGAAVGAAIGAGLGASSTLVIDGPELDFKSGTRFKVKTTGRNRRKD